MGLFLYETHLHTKESSACSVSYGAEYIDAYAKAGYSGIFVTDHFFGGNTSVPKNLDWKTRINLFCTGYENALKESEKYEGFKVFFGFEQTFQGDDYLIYGLDKEWLLSHPDVETMNHAELFAAVNLAHGLMIQAHPFRLRHYIKAIHVHPRSVHGFETFNGGNEPHENELAKMYAKIYNFPETSGSDIHCVDNINQFSGIKAPPKIGGMAFETPLENVNDYITRIKNHQGKLIEPGFSRI